MNIWGAMDWLAAYGALILVLAVVGIITIEVDEWRQRRKIMDRGEHE